MTQSDRVLELAHRQRVVTAADLRADGLSPQLLIRLHHAGQLERLGRGLYGLPDAPVTEDQTRLEVCQRVPKAVLCLLSALHFHDIGSQLPHELWIALPEATHTPALTYPPLRVTRLRGPAYAEGIETVVRHGVPLRVYGVAKTVTDCFKFRNKIGLDVAMEALREAWQQRRVTMAQLQHFARINRVERVMAPYLEAVAH